ncbi:MAG: tRNA pseudouridine(54/55) synthase Pus10 [Candidatus Saliniplasma sp.]
MELLDLTEDALEKELCDHCLGRLFAQLGHGLTNDERGKALRVFYSMAETDEEKVEVPKSSDECTVCGNIFDELDHFASLIVDKFEDIEFDTFLVGTRVDPEIEENEEMLWAELNITTSEPIKSELNREIGKRVFDRIDAEVDLEKPDIKGILDTRFDTVEIEIAPLFIHGRYRKLSRDIPQTKWVCKKCWGKGCEHCGGKGKMYETSVEEILGEPLKDMAFGEDFTLHGMGREDIDAKMVGNGRPFVMEITNPIVRNIDFEELKKELKDEERVEVDSLSITNRDKIIEIKEAAVDKTYKVKIEHSSEVDRAKYKKALHSLKGTKISQRTPQRVSHRRSDKVRTRELKDIHLEKLEGKISEIVIRCESGTYVKELVHGDDGRTEPNLADKLGVECDVLELDVLKVHY